MSASDSRGPSTPIWLYIVGWCFYIYVFVSLLNFSIAESGNVVLSGMYLVSFGVHEIAHIVMSFAPPVITAAAGSISEICFALLLLAATVRTKARFAIGFAGLWLMLAFLSAGEYMADAMSQSLPLIGPGETVQHDWHFVFSDLGWLESSMAIGGGLRIIGILIGVISLIWGIWVIYTNFMRASPK